MKTGLLPVRRVNHYFLNMLCQKRLKPEVYGKPVDEDLFLRRAVKDTVYRLEHTFGVEEFSKSEAYLHFRIDCGYR